MWDTAAGSCNVTRFPISWQNWYSQHTVCFTAAIINRSIMMYDWKIALALPAPLSPVLHINGQLCQFSLSTRGKFIQAAGPHLAQKTSGHTLVVLEWQDQWCHTFTGIFPNHFRNAPRTGCGFNGDCWELTANHGVRRVVGIWKIVAAAASTWCGNHMKTVKTVFHLPCLCQNEARTVLHTATEIKIIGSSQAVVFQWYWLAPPGHCRTAFLWLSADRLWQP